MIFEPNHDVVKVVQAEEEQGGREVRCRTMMRVLDRSRYLYRLTESGLGSIAVRATRVKYYTDLVGSQTDGRHLGRIRSSESSKTSTTIMAAMSKTEARGLRVSTERLARQH